jgi:hypothetical protein
MKRYFFHLLGPDGRSEDAIGAEFDSPDAAYLEAVRAAREISADMLGGRGDPSALRFLVCDQELGPLMEVPFAEALGRRARP